MTYEEFIDSVDQDQTVQKEQSDPHCQHFHSRLKLDHFFILQQKCIFRQ